MLSLDDYGHLLYLVLLLLAVGSWVFVEMRQSLGTVLRQLALWGFIFLAAIAAFGMWGDIRQSLIPRQEVLAETGQITVPRSPDGHYYLTLLIDEVPIQFLVDTGASQVVLNDEDARRIGINPDELAFHGRANTANGEVRTASVKVDEISLGGFTDRNLWVWVNDGELDKSLLGMSYLQRWSSIEISSQALILTR